MSIDSFVRAIGSGVADRDSRKSAEIQEDLRQRGLKERLPPAFARLLAHSFFDSKSPGQIDFEEYKRLVAHDSVLSRRVLNALFEYREDLFDQTHFESRPLLTVVSEIISLKPQIIGVGEEHQGDPIEGVQSTATRFATEVLPQLVEAGYKTLVLEAVPYDWSDDERGKFMKSGRISETETPILDLYFQNIMDRQGYEAIISACRRLNIKIVGGGTPLKEAASHNVIMEKIDDGSIIEAPLQAVLRNQFETSLITVTNAYLQAAVQQETRQGTKVVVYGGGLHNDTSPDHSFAATSIFDDLGETTTVAELDLLVPENTKMDITRALLEMLPHRQSSFARRIRNSWTFFFAETPQTIPAKP